mgnify:CR=1 FL=1
MVDGVDIRQMPLHELRERIGYVPQKVCCFPVPLIQYPLRKRSCHRSRSTRAAEIAQAWDL